MSLLYLIFSLYFVPSILSTTLSNRDTLANTTKHWVILVAGSNGWYNYRHQSDVCHAYHIAIDHGIPPENIITFMYDDIANNSENPFPGKIFNDYNHKDVYEGVKIDYSGADVTPEMFMKVLKGDKTLKEAGRKVLDSGPNDHVFIYFTDHGAEGLIAFPESELYASDLNKTITFMYESHKYKWLVFYLEACESGSMFERILSPRIRVYATTAANPHESSYAAFCDDPEIANCLADEYSYNWLHESDMLNLDQLTLDKEYMDVRNSTIKSHVQKYGNVYMGSLKVSEFQGDKHSKKSNSIGYITPVDKVPSRDVITHILKRRVREAKTEQERKLQARLLARRIKLGEVVEETVAIINEMALMAAQNPIRVDDDIQLVTCAEMVYQTFGASCLKIQQFAGVAKHYTSLRKLCERGVPADIIKQAIMDTCI